MNIRNRQSGKVQLVVATALTLVLSVIQPAEASVSMVYGSNLSFIDGRLDPGPVTRFTNADESAFEEYSDIDVALTRDFELGEMSIIEMPASETRRTHFNFRSYATDELLAATLVTSGETYSLTLDLPAGQVVLENDAISVLTASDFARVDLSGSEISEMGNGHFVAMLNTALEGADLSGFNLSLAESLAEGDLLALDAIVEQASKSGQPYADGGWGCAGALLALAAANAALAAAIAATYVTVGAAAGAIAAAVTAIGIAIVAVDQYCMQK